jgi:exopolyphosphatase/guanosine-5'-triphosphate,3'-diphosphate pyrophosphatase
MKRLRRAMIEDPSGATWFNPEVAREDRLAVLPGGLSILMAIHRSFGLDSMVPSQGALREGLLYDQVGRVGREEVRSRTIDRMVERFAADAAQAERVRGSAMALLEQAPAEWGLDPSEARRVLLWAARLHEAGLAVGHAGYHRHGAYLVANSDMPGFSVDDQALLAAVIRTHRRKIRFEYFEPVASQRVDEAIRLSSIFRLAVLLNRGRVAPPRPEFSVTGLRKLRLRFEEGWLDQNPLTAADLQEEALNLRAVDLRLGFGPAS